MYSFSSKQRPQCPAPALYFFDLVIIFQSMLYSIIFSLRSHINFDNSVLSLCLGFLKLCRWLYHRVLKLFSVNPIYVVSLLDAVLTVAWYTIHLVRHCPLRGHFEASLQLHSFSGAPEPEIWLHIIKVYLKSIRFDTLEIIFEYTLFRKKNFLFRTFLKFGEVCHCNTNISAILKVF